MNKKSKPQKMTLGGFLGPVGSSWTDDRDLPSEPAAYTQNAESFAPRSSCFGDARHGNDMDRGGGGYSQERGVGPPGQLPTVPPYTAFVGNLAYDFTASDLADFFTECGPCNVKDARLPIDKETNRVKGFGYVEFQDLNSLKQALNLSGYDVCDRKIKVDIAEAREKSGGGFGGGYEDKTAGVSTWRREKPMEAPQQARGGFGRPGFGFNRDSQEGGSEPRVFNRDNFGSARPPAGPLATERKKLQLAPRSTGPDGKPVVSTPAAATSTTTTVGGASPSSKSNPFGAAKPIDSTEALKRAEAKLKNLEHGKESKKDTYRDTSKVTSNHAVEDTTKETTSVASKEEVVNGKTESDEQPSQE